MAEFRSGNYIPMDRGYYGAVEDSPAKKLEEPIFSVGQMGETVPEHDPSGRFKNIIQITQAAIRGGAGTIQFVMQTPHGQAIGGRPKAYGEEVRRTLKEVAMATEADIAGLELPTSSLNNLGGFNYQQLQFSDEEMQRGLEEVKDSIKFMADVAQGGEVDIVSWEFPRTINDTEFSNDKDFKFKKIGEKEVAYIVDARTGQTSIIKRDEAQNIAYYGPEGDKNGKNAFKEMTPEDAEFARKKDLQLTRFTWQDFKKWAKHNEELNKKNGKKEGDEGFEPETPEQIYIKVQLEGQIKTMEGWKATYLNRANDTRKRLEDINRRFDLVKDLDPNDPRRQALELERTKAEEDYKDEVHTAYGQAQQALDLREKIKYYKPIKNYAFKRSAQTYGKAGIEAMKATLEGWAKKTVKPDKPIYVGPEIGWPDYYGSHPDEFIELIKGARKEMVELLTSREIKKFDVTSGEDKYVSNEYFDPTVTKKQAEDFAAKHIKGMFDTSHMGMWLAHFPQQTDSQGKPETEESRIARFNKWYKKQIEKLAEEPGLVGGIQLVDSMTAAHSHLPPGEGILPVVDTAKIFKEKGFKGLMVSEGHEEEKFGEGRIRTKLWQHSGAATGFGGYFQGSPVAVPHWGGISGRYFGGTYSPHFLFGGYSPSNEFKLWSEVPLE